MEITFLIEEDGTLSATAMADDSKIQCAVKVDTSKAFEVVF